MKIPCSIIRELLPNYTDDCINEDASQYVKNHLEECEECKVLYEDMKRPIESRNEIEIDYLKKVRKKNYRRIVMVVVISIVVVIGCVWVSRNHFMNQALESNVSIDEVMVKNNRISIVAHYAASDRDLDEISLVNSDGKQGIKFTTMKVQNNTGGSAKRFEIKLKDIDDYIYIGDKVVDKKGKIYSLRMVNMINHRLTYVGDNSTVEKLLNYAGFNDLGPYSIELDTDKEPYVIRINYQDEIKNTSQVHLEQLSKIVLACIDNCNILEIKDASGLELTVNFDQKTNKLDELTNILNK